MIRDLAAVDRDDGDEDDEPGEGELDEAETEADDLDAWLAEVLVVEADLEKEAEGGGCWRPWSTRACAG